MLTVIALNKNYNCVILAFFPLFLLVLCFTHGVKRNYHNEIFPFSLILTLFRMGILGCSRIGGGGGGAKRPPPKICHTCPTMVKLGTVILYVKKIKKI